MKKKRFQKMICDPYVVVSVLAGVVLMCLTVYFRINPVEGSVVSESIRGTLFHYVLLITTMPAWIAGTTLGGATVMSYPLMFIVQIIIYTIAGLILRATCLWYTAK